MIAPAVTSIYRLKSNLLAEDMGNLYYTVGIPSEPYMGSIVEKVIVKSLKGDYDYSWVEFLGGDGRIYEIILQLFDYYFEEI